MHDDLLSYIIPAPAKLAGERAASSGDPETTFSLVATGSKRHVRFGLPLVVRELSPTDLGGDWEEFCGVLRRHGVGLRCAANDLIDVPAAATPIRVGTRHSGSGLEALELETADVFELSCRGCQADESSKSSVWQWPCSRAEPAELHGLISALRVGSGGDTPLGIELPVTANAEDIEECLAAGVDFLTLVGTDQAADTSNWIAGLAGVRRLCQRLDRTDLPLLLDVREVEPRNLPIWLSLGASLIGIDSCLRPVIEAARDHQPAASGMLSGIGAPPTKTASSIAAIDQLLQLIRESLQRQAQLCGVAAVRDLNPSRLRTSDRELRELADIAWLGDTHR